MTQKQHRSIVNSYYRRLAGYVPEAPGWWEGTVRVFHIYQLLINADRSGN